MVQSHELRPHRDAPRAAVVLVPHLEGGPVEPDRAIVGGRQIGGVLDAEGERVSLERAHDATAPLVVVVEDPDRVLPHAREQLALCRGDVVERLEVGQMRSRDVCQDSDVRVGDLGEPRQLAVVAHPHLQHRDLVHGLQLEQRERAAVQVVEVSPRGVNGEGRLEHLPRHLLGRGLARGAGNRHHLHRQPAAHPGCEILQRAQRVAHHDRRRGRTPGRQRGDVRDHETRGTLRRHVGDETMSVVVGSDDGEEQIAGPDRARVDRETRGHGVARPAQRPADGLGDLLQRHALRALKGHRRPPGPGASRGPHGRPPGRRTVVRGCR